ncbi:MAG: GldG family protein [Candidatus Nitrospinota bacterium M3_3B_026]
MRRRLALGSNTVVFAAVVVGIVVVLNFVSAEHYKKFDMTSAEVYTLSPQSKKALAALEEDMTIYAFVRPENRRAFLDLLDQYAYGSGRVTLEAVDPDKRPGLARRLKVQNYGTIVVETASGRRETTEELSEEAVTNAIINASTADVKKIYVLTGHEERPLDDENPLGWSAAREALEAAAYEVESLDWFSTGGIPEDADLLIIPGPKSDFRKEEIDQLRERLEAGGATFITLDPGRLENIEKLLAGYGFLLHDDMVLDPLSQRLGFDPLVATVTKYESHPVVEGFRAATFFPVARSMDLKSNPSRDVKAIGRTGVQSWGETDVDSIEQGSPEYREGDDLPGPRVIAASAEWETGPPKEERKIGEKVKKARFVVVGDSDFAANSTLGFSGNKDLFLNIAGWLLEQEERVSIRPKTRGFNPIMFTSGELKLIFWVTVVAVPALVVAAGVAVRIIRRRA